MKLLCLEASSGSVVGGSLTGMLHLIAGLDRSLYEPVVVLYEDKPVVAELREDGIPVHIVTKRRLPKEHGLQGKGGYEKAKSRSGLAVVLKTARTALTFLAETLPAALELRTLFRKESPDVVYVCNGFRGNMDAIVAARLCGIPCVVHAKGFDKFSFVERWAAPGTAACVSMTEAIREHCLKSEVLAPSNTVIYDGLDLRSFSPKRSVTEVRAELGVPVDAKVVGVVGNVQSWKGQHVLVEALPKVLDSFPNSYVWIVGGVHKSGAAYDAELKARIAELGLGERVLFTGPRDDVPDVMQAMDVVAHTSVRGEPFGRVIIEGMSVGRPVVATRAGGVPEFVEHGVDGILVEPGDVDELASTLCALFGDQSFRNAISEGALRKTETFRLEHHVENMCAVFDTAAGQGD